MLCKVIWRIRKERIFIRLYICPSSQNLKQVQSYGYHWRADIGLLYTLVTPLHSQCFMTRQRKRGLMELFVHVLSIRLLLVCLLLLFVGPNTILKKKEKEKKEERKRSLRYLSWKIIFSGINSLGDLRIRFCKSIYFTFV